MRYLKCVSPKLLNLVIIAVHGLSDNSVRSVHLPYVVYGFAFAKCL